MSRNPQGVSSFIPAYQPYQVDFNFVNQVLGYKQNQYDQNWKQLNKLYGQLYYADVTHDMSEQKKTALVKDIDFNLKRVSGLDLSLEQNVTQATQVFKPFYEDKNLMYDMAWTKNTSGQKMRGENFKNSSKKEDQAQYWPEGIRAIDYKIDEFKESSYDQIRNVGQASYTPYRNVNKEAQLFAKEMGVEIQTPSFSPDGRYRIITTNGKPLEEPLARLFESTFGNDPGIIDVYRTQAYVNRKDTAYTNAAQFNGDKNAAEMEYLKSNYNILKIDNQARVKNLKSQSNVYDNRIKILQKKYDETKNPQYKDAIESFQLNKDIVDNLVKQSESSFSPDETSKTASTSSGFINPFGDVASLRAKVDGGMAAKLLNKDINESASIYAATHSKIDMKADEYKVMEVNHAYDLSRMKKQHEYTMQEKAYDLEIADAKKKIEDGVAELKDGKLVIKDEYNYSSTFITDKGAVTAANQNMLEFTQKEEKTFTEAVSTNFKTVLAGLRELQQDGLISEEKVKNLLGNKSFADIDKNQAKMNVSELTKISDKIKNYITTSNTGLVLDKLSNANAFITSLDQIEQSSLNIKASNAYQAKLTKAMSQRAVAEGFTGAGYLYDKDGNERTEKQWQIEMDKAGLSDIVPPDVSEIASRGFKVSGSPLLSAVAGWMSSTQGVSAYNMLKEKMQKLSTDENILKQVGTVPFTGGTGFNETGSFSMGSQIQVVPGYRTGTSIVAEQTGKQLLKLDLEDKNNISISFNGTTNTGYNTGKGTNRSTAINMTRQFFNDLNFKDEGKEMGNAAVIEFLPVAGGSLDIQAVTYKPTLSWLKSNGYIAEYDDEGGIKTPGILSKQEATNILTNGVSIMFPKGQLKGNQQFDAATYDPIKNYVDQTGSYTYVNPKNSNYNYTVKKATNGYDLSWYTQTYDPSTNTFPFIKENDFMNYQADGQGLSKALQEYQLSTDIIMNNVDQGNKLIRN